MTLVVRAITANALTSNGAHWSNGTGPVLGAAVAANGNQVTIDSVIPGGESAPITAGSFVSGVWYRIIFSGTTTWTAIGAASNNVGTVFQATGVGSGTGQAVAITTITTLAAGAAAAGGGFTLSAAVAFSVDVRAGTTACVTVSGSNSYVLSGVRILGGTAANAVGINHTGSGLIIAESGCICNGGTGTNSHGMIVNGSGAVLRLDAALDVRSGAATGTTCGVNLLLGSVEVLNGSVVNGSGGGGAHGILGAAGTVITINNSTINGGPTASAGVGVSSAGTVTGSNSIYNASTSEALVITGNGFFDFSGINQANASASSYAITATGTATTSTWSGIVNNRPATGVAHSALNARKLNIRPVAGQQQIFNGSDNTIQNLYSALDPAIFNNPLAADVKAGVTYGPGGALVGTYAQTVSPSLAQIADAVPSVEDISTQLERSGGMLDTASDTLATLQPRLQDAATTAGVAEIVTTALSAM